MKTCPFCAEEIQDQAIKCKHCGEIVVDRDPSAFKPPPVPKPKRWTFLRVGRIGWASIGAVLFVGLVFMSCPIMMSSILSDMDLSSGEGAQVGDSSTGRRIYVDEDPERRPDVYLGFTWMGLEQPEETDGVSLFTEDGGDVMAWDQPETYQTARLLAHDSSEIRRLIDAGRVRFVQSGTRAVVSAGEPWMSRVLIVHGVHAGEDLWVLNEFLYE